MVRKEWRLARQEGVCMLPVIASPNLAFQSLPHWMGAVHFTNPDIDDIWNRAHLKPFMQGGPHCARLITTRDNSSLPKNAASIPVDAMQKDEAVELLKTGLPSAYGEAMNNSVKSIRILVFPELRSPAYL